MKIDKARGGLMLASALLATAGVVASVARAQEGAAMQPKNVLVEKGRHLVNIMGCQDCHTPHDEKGMLIKELAFSGHPEKAPLPKWSPEMMKDNILVTMGPTVTAFAGPFGLSVAGNLTPDPETGIGKKTAEDLIQSWRSGKHWKEDRLVLPPMPMEPVSHLTDEEIRAIHAYLMTLKPIKNACPPSKPVPMPDKD